jgi:hypothetical protein
VSTVAAGSVPGASMQGVLGRPFVGHVVDYLVIGGGLSLFVVAWVLAQPEAAARTLGPALPWLLLLVNGAHFESSTARLYTRPGALARWPFLTHGLPLVALVAIAAGALAWQSLGRHVHALYFTWSPFHYAAQTYGLAAMYCARAGTSLTPFEVRALRLTCLLPFVFAFVASPSYGLFWLVPVEWFSADPARVRTLELVHQLLRALTWGAPVALVATRWLVRRPLPLIVLVLMIANASWWLVLGPREGAFGWAAVFHGLQYLAIVTIFHVRERPDLPAWRSGLVFYVVCVAGGYALFNCWPEALAGAGFGVAGSVLMCTAVVNIHHFIVDAYIWKFRRDPNAAVVSG